MARKVNNKKDFLIIALNKEETKSLGFGYTDEGDCLCMQCNNTIDNIIYYVAVLNDTMCKECLKDFLKRATHYKEDEWVEQRNYNYYKIKLAID